MLYRHEFALAGYEFCISTLEEKIEREKEIVEDILSGRELWLFSGHFPKRLHRQSVGKGVGGRKVMYLGS